MSKINSNAETKVQEGFKNAGADLMAPITARFEKSAVVLRPKRSIGEFAKRIARRTSSLAQRRVTIKAPNTPNSKSTVIVLGSFSPIILCSNLFSKLFENGEKWLKNPLSFLAVDKKG